MQGYNDITQLIQGSLIPVRQNTLIEIPIGAGLSQNQGLDFGNQNTLLDNCIVTGVETYYDTILSKAPSGRPLITQADLAKLTVNFSDTTQGQDFAWMKNYPLINFVTSLNSGIMKQVFWRFITLNKCKLNVVDPTVTAGTSVVLVFNYWTVEQYVLYLRQMGFIQQADMVQRLSIKK